MAEGAAESPATERMMGEICEAGNLRKALQQVRANKGAPGVDGMTVDELTEYLGRHEAELRGQLLDGTYRPQPVRRVVELTRFRGRCWGEGKQEDRHATNASTICGGIPVAHHR